MSPLLNVDFHCHTMASRDSLNGLPALLKTARRHGLQRLVITDHNTIRGALQARRMDAELVIVGEEILTTRGELLAAFVQEEVPPRLSPLATIERLREQGAFISVSHPFDRGRHGWALDDLLEIAPLVDAIEVFNARCVRADLNVQAQRFANEHGLAGTAGSDAHVLFEVGQARLVLPEFSNAAELRSVLPQARVQARLSSPMVHLGSVLARFYQSIWLRRYKKA